MNLGIASAATCAALGRSGRRQSIGWLASRSGATAAEFALILPVFLVLLMSLVEFGRAFWFQVSLRQAVEQTARYAMAEYTRESFSNPDFVAWFNDWTPSLEARAPDELYAWNPSAITFTATTEPASSADDVDFVTIDASYSFAFIFPVVLGQPGMTLTAKSRTPLVGAMNSLGP